jgi:DNA-binding LytR/AlgR family response regulator
MPVPPERTSHECAAGDHRRDEPVLREELAEHLARLWPELQVVAKVEDGVKALRAVEDHRPDVAFLDIQMPGLSGFDVARQLAGRCHVAFVTAFDRHAVEAFEQGAVDYVMKPFTAGRLMTTVTRLREKYSTAPPDLTACSRAWAGRRRARAATCAGSTSPAGRPCASSRSRTSSTSGPTASTRSWSRATAIR